MISAQWIPFFASLALKSILVLSLAWIAALLLRKRSAATRHLIWTAASAALLALPLLAISLPSLPLKFAPAFTAPNITFATTTTQSAEMPGATAQHQATTRRSTAPTTTSPFDWRTAIILLWTAGALFSLLRMTTACISIARLRRTSTTLNLTEVDTAKSTLGINEHIDILQAPRGAMPMSFGFLRPAIVLPEEAAHWTAERRRVVLLHELAHVRRGDFATHILARTAFSLYWWNPLAHIAWREFLKERERAADDLVLHAGAPPADYANHLLDIARNMQTPDGGDWATVAIARPSQLEGRLRAILDSSVNRGTARTLTACIAVLAALAIVAPLAAVRAQDAPRNNAAVDVEALVRSANSQKNPALLDDAAKVAEESQNYDTARQLLDAALTIRENVSGVQSADYGTGLIKIADLERRRNHPDEAKALYTKAAAAIGNHPEAYPALVRLGTAAIKDKQLDAAFDYFERAKLADPSRTGEATMWTAIVRNKQGATSEANELFQHALSIVDRQSSEAATIMRVYSQFLDEQKRTDDAASMREEVAAIRKAQSAAAKANIHSSVPRIGKGITPPTLLSKVEPQYSDEARAAKISGTEVLYAEIGPDGIAHNVSIVSGVGLGLDEKGIEAIQQWRFKPATKDGQPITVAVNIEINFKLI